MNAAAELLASLLGALLVERDVAPATDDTKPPAYPTLLAWCVARAPDGADPVPAAWAACDSDITLRDLLSVLEYPFVAPEPPGAMVYPPRAFCAPPVNLITPAPGCGPGGHCPGCCAALRAAVPTLTLGEVAARAARLRGAGGRP